MNGDIARIIQKAENMRAFTQGSSIDVRYFVLFLLFGVGGDDTRFLRRRSAEIIRNRQSCAFISMDPIALNAADAPAAGNRADSEFPPLYAVSRDATERDHKTRDGRLSAAQITGLAEEAIGDASSEQIPLNDLNTIHICPVISGTSGAPEAYVPAVLCLRDFFTRRHRTTYWKPFIFLDANERYLKIQNDWLRAAERGMDELTASQRCSCCVLTNNNEKAYQVSMERRINTALFIAFLHVAGETSSTVGNAVALPETSGANKFYTAQTASVANPVITRALSRLIKIFELLVSRRDGGVNVKKIDAGFLQPIINRQFGKMPQIDGSVSLDPLYSVIPTAENEDDFIKRLNAFCTEHYVSLVNGAAGDDAMFKQAGALFVKAFLDLLVPLRDIHYYMADGGWLEDPDKAPGKKIADLSPIKDGRQPDKILYLYKQCAKALKRALAYSGGRMARTFLESDFFTALSGRCKEADDKLKGIYYELMSEERKRRADELRLSVADDPDENWYELNKSDLENRAIKTLNGAIADLILCDGGEAKGQAVQSMLDDAFALIDANMIALENDAFMKAVSRSAGADVTGETTRRYISEIRDGLVFPIRTNNAVMTAEGSYCICASENNALCVGWRERRRENTSFLPLKSDERFEVLRISSQFSREDIFDINDDAAYSAQPDGDTAYNASFDGGAAYSAQPDGEAANNTSFVGAAIKEHTAYDGKAAHNTSFDGEAIKEHAAFNDVKQNNAQPDGAAAYGTLLNGAAAHLAPFDGAAAVWPAPFSNIKGGYSDGKIHLNWRSPAGSPSMAYVVPLSENDGGIGFDETQIRYFALRDNPTGASFNYKGVYGVRILNLCVFATDEKTRPDFENLIYDPRYRCCLVTGSAAVKYDVRDSAAGGSLRRLDVRLDPSTFISKGVLGYAFEYGGVAFKSPFPGELEAGTVDFGGFYLPENTELRICLLNGEQADVALIRDKTLRLPKLARGILSKFNKNEKG